MIMLKPFNSEAWISNTVRNEARLCLVCFPYAGGDALIFRDWDHHFPSSIQVCSVQLPGRGRRLLEPAFTKLDSLIDTLTQVLRPLLDKPFALFGHSMGALVSFELAHSLRARYNLCPSYLFVSACRAPQLPAKSPPTYNLPNDELVEALRRLNGTPRQVLENPELMELMLPAIRADFEMTQTYQYLPKPALNCPIVAMGGLSDPDVTREDLEAWAKQTCSHFGVGMFPGDHFYLQTSASSLLQVLNRQLQPLLDHSDSG
jgi:medium-chain acyl-[acyl-carrier-protein] hydrolase